MAENRAEADLLFRGVGITFAVCGEEAGSERLIPFDVVPRIITAAEWRLLFRGLRQRVTALNAFIAGIDVVRAGESEFVVLEDRKVMVRLFPALFARCAVEPVEHYPDMLPS